MSSFGHNHCIRVQKRQEYKILFLDVLYHLGFYFVLELGKEEEKVFDPNSLDADRCESCYGAESEDIR